jgi:recombinational DNA repair ATPase RecF
VAQSERVYGKEIAMLQQIVSQRKTQLDSATIAIIDQNLEIIDAAIARSRAALARDPASRLLSDQLNHVLDKKVELLRTAAMLPAST